MTDDYDVVVLGGGSGGYSAALRAAELGNTVGLIEADKVGGTCLHRGCIPTKALLHSAEVLDTVREAATYGVRATLEGIDHSAVAAHRNRVVTAMFRGLTGLIAGRGITVIDGFGTLSSPTSIEVSRPDGSTLTVTGRHLVIATGSAPREIPGVTVDHHAIITSDDALTREQPPASAIILGAGAIGCEFASAWHSFGAQITIVEACDELLPAEEPTSGTQLRTAFTRRGITSITGMRVAAATATADGAQVTLADGRSLTAEVVLVAIGRAPATAGLGLEKVGVEIDRGYIVTDANGQTSVPGVHAVGDVIATPQLAHAGFAEGILVAEAINGRNPAPIDYTGVPRVTYSHPEVASVGLTSTQAREQGHEIITATYDLAGNARARILGAHGSVTVIAAADGPVLGVHMVGERAGDLISEAQLIVNWEARPDEVAPLIHAHPTMSEALGEAHLALAGKPLHAHS
ncbi:dihydrolipoyl dehydrogenase [Williamsia sp. CHRR-6]|uniref:dihydrolipoyl dehydrogenase n=1 Tax=Williamsia sp. CHRR-6 TaxID=2835871 RepID=UPI001BDB2285|nr:dihydrolipoyl dehydrogenase [Williamsia sp. CHRR-6]MBT0566099.1 dihydrolipoyl dehydrogenase [Williamsia sp. CHRR-6]